MERQETETQLVKKPDDREILEAVDVESAYPERQPSECAASPVYRCPYRRYKDSLTRRANVELLSQEAVPLGRTDGVEVIELVDLDGMYPESRYVECTAPSGYRCAYRRYNKSPAAAQVGMLHEIGSGLSHSRPLRFVPGSRSPVTGK